MTTTPSNAAEKPTLGHIARVGGIATGAAILINAALYVIGSLFTFPDDALTPTGDPVTLAPVILVTLIGGLAALVGYTVLTRFLARRTANRVMLILAALVLIGMFFNPFTIENVPAAQIVILQIMHVVAAWPAWRLTR